MLPKSRTSARDRQRLRQKVLARDNYRCQIQAAGICAGFGVKLKPSLLEIDHIRPVERGGSDAMSNLRAACRLCNLALAAGVSAVGASREW